MPMRSIRLGDRGPAVEDVQRRLLVLGHDIGPSGVDGVFLGRTAEAVVRFQRDHGLAEDRLVGPLTWAALVDATFVLGDRDLYLRLPHFHGADVRTLQEALNALGFSAGPADGVFGAYCERAVREFQANTGLRVDGIVGAETARSIIHLRHVWEGKTGREPSAARTAAARPEDVLSRCEIALRAGSPGSRDVAGRMVNLALATTDSARVSLVSGESHSGALLVDLVTEGNGLPGVPTAHDVEDVEIFTSHIRTAILSSGDSVSGRIAIALGDGVDSVEDSNRQRLAVRVLDALCAALSGFR